VEGSSYPGDFEKWMKVGSWSGAAFSEGALWEEPGGKTPLVGNPKDILIKALEMGVSFHEGPVLGERGGTLFS